MLAHDGPSSSPDIRRGSVLIPRQSYRAQTAWSTKTLVPSDATPTSTRDAVVPDTGSAAGEPRRQRVRPWRRLLTLALLLALGTTAGLFTLALKRSALQAVEAQSDLQRLATQLHELDGQEWRLRAGDMSADDMASALSVTAADIQYGLHDAGGEGLSLGAVTQISAAFGAYHEALDRLIALQRNDSPIAAVQVDEDLVDPRFDSLDSILEQHIIALGERAAHQGLISDLGILATIVSLMGTSAWVLERGVRADARHRAEHEAGERYRALVDQSSDLVMVSIAPDSSPSAAPRRRGSSTTISVRIGAGRPGSIWSIRTISRQPRPASDSAPIGPSARGSPVGSAAMTIGGSTRSPPRTSPTSPRSRASCSRRATSPSARCCRTP